MTKRETIFGMPVVVHPDFPPDSFALVGEKKVVASVGGKIVELQKPTFPLTTALNEDE